MEPASLQPGHRIGHYVVERLVAVGGSSEVYRARDPRAARDVAVKWLRRTDALDGARQRRLLHEARAYTRLVHPRIVTLYEVGEHGGRPFLVMEWVDGITLAERLEKGRLETQEALRVMTQVADGLSAAHALGLAHRDVKPANIMLTSEGDAKLLDFGLAKQVEEGEPVFQSLVTTDGALLGTPAYMSPEQARGLPLTLASDVFSFGVVLFEVLTGRSAFGRPSTLETLNAVAGGRVTPLPRMKGRVGRGLARLAARCLEPKPEDRPRDARELIVELQRLGRPGGVVVGPRSRGRLGVCLAAVAAALAMLIGWQVLRPGQGQAAPGRGARYLSVDGSLPVLSADGSAVAYTSVDNREIWFSPLGHGNPELVWAGHDKISGLALAPDTRHALFAAVPHGGPPWVWEVPLDGNLPRKVTQGFAPAVSPDGRWVAALVELADRGRQLVVCRRDGTERRVLATFERALRPLSCAFAGDGGSIVVVLTDGVRWSRLVRVGCSDGGVDIVTEVQGVAEKGIAVVSSANSVLWCLQTSVSSDYFLSATDLKTGFTGLLYPGPGTASHPSVSADGSSILVDLRAREQEIVEVQADPEGDESSSSYRVLSGTRGASQPRVSPNGDRVVYRSVRGDLWIRERTTGSMGPLLTTGTSAFNPSWSPDGHMVAYGCINGGHSGLWIAGADGSDPRPIAEGPWNAYHPEWHPDGRHLVFVSDRDGQEGLYCLDVPTGEVTGLDSGSAFNPAVAPDGRTIAYVSPSDSDDDRLCLADLAEDCRSLKRRWTYPVVINRWAGAKPRFSRDGRWLAFDQPSGPVGAEIWVLPVAGPDQSEARRLTKFDVPVSLVFWFDWSPGGELVVALSRNTDRVLLLEDANLWLQRALR